MVVSDMPTPLLQVSPPHAFPYTSTTAVAVDGDDTTTDDTTTDAATVDVRALAQEFHDEGFVALLAPQLQPPMALIERVRTAVLCKYDAHLALARTQQLDLARIENAERLAGFYVRQGGRIDMQISATEFQSAPRVVVADIGADNGGDSTAGDALAIDIAPFHEMARCWQSVINEIFRSDSDTAAAAAVGSVQPAPLPPAHRYCLEYIGCVVARPGDADQNWHLDGVHRNLQQHERADRLNVFVPLVDLDARVGGTEMKRASHWRAAVDGAAFTSYAHLDSVTHCVRAGTPVVMDYRVWHRGLANASTDTLRPLLYFKYVQQREASSGAGTDTSTSIGSGAERARKRKRVVLTQVTS